nr:bifunctional [glutamate--ammonia ligase]-adenylyl-L-tyrosine phosphorylase/[glutamate--ammonia-ligase] adenylyltransferase [Allosphingosinicella vermicomposti]
MIRNGLDRAQDHSPYLRMQLGAFPAITAALEEGRLDEALILSGEIGKDQAPAAAIRLERNAFALTLGIGDLAGAFDLVFVVETLSDLADRLIERALSETFQERTPDAEPEGFAILALGKHGSRELNYSSDVDLLFLFDPERLPCRPREEPAQAAVRIGQKVIELLQKRDGHGYAFRVDLRLRPSPEVTPIALPVNAAISYYESTALPWERAAFIRARIVAGDQALGRYFMEAIHPFVWRRSLDYGALGEIQTISRRIRDHYAEGQKLGPGFDLKRGRGGIREIEFFAQIHQLIHGGREPGLRAPSTLHALAALADAGRIGRDDADALCEGYRLFRTIEHRLQMVDDRQTHALPNDAPSLDNVAQLHGLSAGAELVGILEPHVARVSAIYGRLSGQEEDRLPRGPDVLEAQLSAFGFADPGAARQRIEGWRAGKARSLRTNAAMEAFEAMLPKLVPAFGAAPDPMAAMNRFDDMVERLPTGVNFYRLIEARPALTEIVATVLSHAPTLAEQLGRRPELLDGLIDETAFLPAPSVEDLAASFSQGERGEDYQMLLDRVRRSVNERRFALGVQLILARSDPLEVAAGYARVAEAAIRVLADAAISAFEAVHGKVPGSELLVLGLGRLGGEALTYASDLDLIYIFTGDYGATSDGGRPLGATEYYNRLAPRVSAALSVPTAAGPLYEVDTRLRPSGADGLLAVSLASFEDYQANHAWTWEHMALTRARPVYGSQMGRDHLAAAVDTVLRAPRDETKLRADAARMRAEMARHKPPAGYFDIKLEPGGLVDLEFAVQVLALTHQIGLDPRLPRAIEALTAAGLVPPEIADAHRLLTAMLVMFRLVSPSSAEPPGASRFLVARACGMDDWNALLAAYDRARRSVSDLWRQVSRGEDNGE